MMRTWKTEMVMKCGEKCAFFDNWHYVVMRTWKTEMVMKCGEKDKSTM